MKRYVTATLAALAAPAAAGTMFMASPATAAVATTAAPAAALRCHASMSNSRPKDYTTIYVDVGTVRYAGVTTIAHYKTVNRKHTGKANAEGNAKLGYPLNRTGNCSWISAVRHGRSAAGRSRLGGCPVPPLARFARRGFLLASRSTYRTGSWPAASCRTR